MPKAASNVHSCRVIMTTLPSAATADLRLNGQKNKTNKNQLDADDDARHRNSNCGTTGILPGPDYVSDLWASSAMVKNRY